MRTTLLATTLLMALGAVSTAAAFEIDAWDQNGDGVLNPAELRAGFEQAGLFSQWDVDSDNRLTPDELAEGLYEFWNVNDDQALTVDEWDRAVDRWFGERAVNLSVAAWDNDSDGIISRNEFEQGLKRTDLFGRLEPEEDSDELVSEDELSDGLFGGADDIDVADDDESTGLLDLLFGDENEDGWFDVDAEPDAVGSGFADEAAAMPEEPPADDFSLIEEGEPFVQLPIPCGERAGDNVASCEQVAERFCEALGYQPPIDILDVDGRLYVIRCRDEP